MLESAGAAAQQMWVWWTGELIGMWPRQRNAGRLRYRRVREVALANDRSIAIRDLSGDAAKVIGSFRSAEVFLGDDASGLLASTGGTPLVISADIQVCFAYRLDLPKSARRHIDGIVRLEFARLTPFAPSEILSGWFERPVPGYDDRLAIVHIVLRRDFIEPVLQKLHELGRPFPEILVRDSDGAMLPVRLSDHEPAPENAADRIWRKLAFAAFLAASLAGIFAIQQVFARQDRQLEEIASMIEAASRDAAAVRDRIAAIEASARRVANLRLRKEAAMPTLAVWNELTRLLPDSAWLSSLSIEETNLSIEGNARTAEQLIPALNASPLFESVAFAGPVTKSQGNDLIRFTIRMSLAKTGDATQ